MQFYFITRGVKEKVDSFIAQLQYKFLPVKWKNKEGKEEDRMLQMGLRPVQLWECAFPKEHKDVILNTILEGGEGLPLGNNGTEPTEHKWITRLVKWGQKFLGLKPIGDYAKAQKMPMFKPDVQVIALGIKEDYTRLDGNEGI